MFLHRFVLVLLAWSVVGHRGPVDLPPEFYFTGVEEDFGNTVASAGNNGVDLLQGRSDGEAKERSTPASRGGGAKKEKTRTSALMEKRTFISAKVKNSNTAGEGHSNDGEEKQNAGAKKEDASTRAVASTSASKIGNAATAKEKHTKIAFLDLRDGPANVGSTEEALQSEAIFQNLTAATRQKLGNLKRELEQERSDLSNTLRRCKTDAASHRAEMDRGWSRLR
ncbi:unnamed protein product, partial [Amoebophrya sp. A25]|eukprot:GSA25T00025695001.1